jgi:hypothetical protein
VGFDNRVNPLLNEYVCNVEPSHQGGQVSRSGHAPPAPSELAPGPGWYRGSNADSVAVAGNEWKLGSLGPHHRKVVPGPFIAPQSSNARLEMKYEQRLMKNTIDRTGGPVSRKRVQEGLKPLGGSYNWYRGR